MPHSALCDSAASTVEQMHRHLIVFGKSGKHRANTLACSCGIPRWPLCADAEHKPIDKNKKINGNLDILVPPPSYCHSFATGVATSPRYSSLTQVDSFRIAPEPRSYMSL